MNFGFKNLPIQGLILIEYQKFADERGNFMELYRQSDFADFGLPSFVQDNCSYSQKGVLRGFHYQLPPKVQGKLITVLEGKIYDVAVDIRKTSPSFKKWHGIFLDENSSQAFYIPPGFAHAFLVVSETARVLYKATAEYAPALERGIIWNDTELNIPWPITVPKLKPRDANFPALALAEVF